MKQDHQRLSESKDSLFSLIFLVIRRNWTKGVYEKCVQAKDNRFSVWKNWNNSFMRAARTVDNCLKRLSDWCSNVLQLWLSLKDKMAVLNSMWMSYLAFSRWLGGWFSILTDALKKTIKDTIRMITVAFYGFFLKKMVIFQPTVTFKQKYLYFWIHLRPAARLDILLRSGSDWNMDLFWK